MSKSRWDDMLKQALVLTGGSVKICLVYGGSPIGQ